MKLPILLVNFKLYEQGTGRAAVELAKIHQQVADELGVNIAIAVNALDLESVVNEVSIPVFVQHLDPVSFGSNTGHILPELVKEKGAFGTLLNHAENPLGDIELKKSIERAREVELYTVVCAQTPEDGAKMIDWEPDLIAVEPPELIGGDISVSKSSPAIIEKAVELIGESKTLVGAGVKDCEDVQIAKALGACGVLVASGVVKVEDSYSALTGLAKGFLK